MKKLLIQITTFLAGLYFALEFILPEKIGNFQFGYFSEDIINSIRIISAMAIGLGIINVIKFHGIRIIKSQSNWFFSVVLVCGMALMLILGGVKFRTAQKYNQYTAQFSNFALYLEKIDSDIKSQKISLPQGIEKIKLLEASLNKISNESQKENMPLSLDKVSPILRESFEKEITYAVNLATNLSSENYNSREDLIKSLNKLHDNSLSISSINLQSEKINKVIKIFESGIFTACGSTMFSLLAFYVANAAYRSFRVHSVESALLMLFALLVILGQIPQGSMYISENLPHIRRWILLNLSTPVNRVIILGGWVAGIGASIRIWFSLEASPLDNK